MTKLLNAAGRGGSGPAETTAKLTDLSDSDIVIDLAHAKIGRPRPIDVFHDGILNFQPILMRNVRKQSLFRLLFRHPCFSSNHNTK